MKTEETLPSRHSLLDYDTGKFTSGGHNCNALPYCITGVASSKLKGVL